jgi:hypothetical protein
VQGYAAWKAHVGWQRSAAMYCVAIAELTCRLHMCTARMHRLYKCRRGLQDGQTQEHRVEAVVDGLPAQHSSSHHPVKLPALL